MRKALSIGAAIGTAGIIALASASSSTATPAPVAHFNPAPVAGPQGAPPPIPKLQCGGSGLVNEGIFDHDGSEVHDTRTAAQIIDVVLAGHAPASVAEAIAARRMTLAVNERGWQQHLVRDRGGKTVGAFVFSVHPGGLLLDQAAFCND